MNIQSQTKNINKNAAELKSIVKLLPNTLALERFLLKAKKHSLGIEVMELMIQNNVIGIATSHIDKFYGLDTKITLRLLKSRQMLGKFNYHSFTDLPKSILPKIVALKGGLSITHITLANFTMKDQAEVMEALVKQYKNDVLLNFAQQLSTTHGLTNKMAFRIMKYLPPQSSHYLEPICKNVKKYPLLNKRQLKSDLEKAGFTSLVKKYSKNLNS